MLTFEDCKELSHLSEDEILEIAEHEHIPMMTALELGEKLLQSNEGEHRILRMLICDIEDARRKSKLARAQRLESVLQNFVATHPKTARIA